MRILHVITNLERGGAQLSVVGIAAGLRARGFDVHVAFSSRGGSFSGSQPVLARELRDRAVPLHDVSAMRRAVSPADPLAFAALERLVRDLAPDVVHTHASKAGLLGRLAAARSRVPHILHTVRGWSWHGRTGATRALFLALERSAGRVTDRFIAVAEAMVAAGLAQGVGTRDRYSVIRSGIELDRFARRRDAAAIRAQLGLTDAQVVGAVTRFDPAKGPFDVVAIAARVAAHVPRARFLVVCGGNSLPAMRRAIERAGLRSRFVLVGERPDIADALAAMDVFLLTSRWEGMPRVVVEAAASRLPIVTTDVGGVREIVEHERSGLVYPPGDVDALAAGVARLLADRALATRFAASAHVPRDFDLAHVVDEHAKLYAGLAR